MAGSIVVAQAIGQQLAVALQVLAHAPGVRHVRARCIEFVGNESMPAQADGDAAGRTPMSIIDAPSAIPVVVG